MVKLPNILRSFFLRRRAPAPQPLALEGLQVLQPVPEVAQPVAIEGPSLDLYVVKNRIVHFIHEQSSQDESLNGKLNELKEKNAASLAAAQLHQSTLQKSAEAIKGSLMDIQNLTEQFQKILVIHESLSSLIQIETAVSQSLTEIDSVVLNSKILAFNASLEAGRAGQAGRGFLVVSEKMKEFSLEISSIAQTIRASSLKSQSVLAHVTESIDDATKDFELHKNRALSSMTTIDSNIQVVKDNLAFNLEQMEHQQLDLLALQQTMASSIEKGSASAAEVISFIQDSQITQIEPRQAVQQLSGYFKIIDVRRADEFNAELGHIDGAELITVDDEFARRMEQLPKDQAYLFVCRSGGRSARAARIAVDLKFTSVTNLVGGMLKWNELHLPVVGHKKAS